jgi:alkylhydroperoxidase family enzyme
MARVDYADLDKLPEDAKALLATRRSPGGNIFRMFANANRVTAGYLGFGTALRKHLAIDIILYEYVIVRVANLSKSPYVIRQHEQFLRRNKVDEDKILSLRTNPSPRYFDEKEMAMLRFVDEFTLNVRVSDATFAEAKRHFTPEQLMHVSMTAGLYMFTARVAESFDIEMEPPRADST